MIWKGAVEASDRMTYKVIGLCSFLEFLYASTTDMLLGSNQQQNQKTPGL
jgi:predicted GNAT family acetyltransferase